MIVKTLVLKKRIYQVLSLGPKPDETRAGSMMSLKDILRGAR